MSTPTFNTEDRSWLQRGYPHIRLLVADHPDDAPKKIAKATAKVVNAIDPVYHVRWPREVAARFVRLFAGEPDRRLRHKGSDKPAGPPTADEAEKMIVRALESSAKKPWHVYPYDVEDFVLLLEAFVGPEAVVRGIVSGIEHTVKVEKPAIEKFLASYNPKTKQYKRRRPQSDYLSGYMLIPLGALFLRAPKKLVEESKTRLEKLLNANAKLAQHNGTLTSLTMLLHGKEGVEQMDTSWHRPVAFLFSGDPRYVESSVKTLKGEVDIDVYAVWAGGEAVLDGYAKHVKKVRRTDADHVAEGIGMFASSHAVPLMLELAVKKCDRAEAWLLEHMDIARSELEKIAKTGKKQGERAQAILDQVGKGAARKGKKAKPSAPPTPEEAEAALDKLMDDLVTTIEKVRGNKTKEAAAFADAAAGYMEIRSSMDEPATEYMGHFFMVDGICLSQDRPTAWERLDPSEEESDRWGKYLEKHELAD